MTSSFDARQMLRDFRHDRSRFGEMANSVAAEIPHHVARMRDDLNAGRLEGLEYAARYVGMLFDSLLAQPAAEAARDLESAARRRVQLEAEFAFESLEDEIEDVLDELVRSRTASS